VYVASIEFSTKAVTRVTSRVETLFSYLNDESVKSAMQTVLGRVHFPCGRSVRISKIPSAINLLNRELGRDLRFLSAFHFFASFESIPQSGP
jgi:hypothetical protein